MKFTTLCFSLLTACAFATPTPQSGAIDPDEVSIESVTWNGSGCRMGSSADTNYQISDDRRSITVIYSNYIAQSGGGSLPSAGRKNCLINFKLRIPKGWQFTLSQTTFHGFADMGSGCNGWVQASYWFTGSTQRASSRYTFNRNTVTDNYDKTTTVAAIWPGCASNNLFNVNSEVFITCQPGYQGQLTVDSIDHVYKETYLLGWARC